MGWLGVRFPRLREVSTGVVCLVFLLITEIASAIPPKVRPELDRTGRASEPGQFILNAADLISDHEIDDREANRTFRIFGREKEADDLLDTLVRLKGSVPVLIGSAGAGKTTVVTRALQKTMLGKFPKTQAHYENLKNAVWISTTGSRISNSIPGRSDAAKMETFLDAVLLSEQILNRPFIVFIDEIHTLDSEMVEAMLPYLDSTRNRIRLVGASNANKFQLKFRENDAVLRRMQQLPVEEMDKETTLSTLRQYWIPKIEETYSVRFGEGVAEAVVENSTTINREAGRFDGSIKLLTDIAIHSLRKEYQESGVDAAGEAPLLALPGPTVPVNAKQRKQQRRALRQQEEEELDIIETREITREQAYEFITHRTGYPVNPHDHQAILEYSAALRNDLSAIILDQPRMVNDTVDVLETVLIGNKKGLGVVAITGPTGTGKSELGENLARLAFKNPKSFLRLDGNDYKNSQFSTNKLFGAEAGVITTNTRVGLLCDYFDDPSKGKYGGVIQIDEAEKASPQFWERLMEFFEKGSFNGGDGRTRHAVRHLVILTSNRGDKILFPENAVNWNETEITARTQEISEDEIRDVFKRKTSGKDEAQIADSVLGRVDKFTLSSPITQGTAERIVRLTIENFRRETRAEFKLEVEMDEAVIRYLLGLDYNLRNGARPLVRGTQRILVRARTQALAGLPLTEGSTLRVGIQGTDTANPEVTITSGDNAPLRFGVPRPEAKNPLTDPVEREVLLNLGARMKERIWGQDDAAESISQAVIAHRASPKDRTKPLPLFLIGSTGVGKTGLGRALAYGLFGSEDRAVVIPLGDITNEAQFNKIFGSEPGFIGSQQERIFEEALRNNPQGGVLVWDEASNMGGRSKELKEAFFKKFYSLIEEGNWTSPATGTTYDLSKWTMIFTGNDGEGIFRGLTSDGLLLDRWQHNKAPDKVRGLLLESGVPQAFLGRQADCILMKPLLRNEVTAIAKKFLNEQLESYREMGLEIPIDDEFAYRFGQAFFSTDMGARSIRNVTEHRLRGILSDAVLRSNVTLGTEPKPRIELTLDDKRIERPYRHRLDPEETVHIGLRITQGAQELYSAKVDLSKYAYIPGVMSASQALMTAYHEAGHVIANRPEKTGRRMGHVTIRIGKMANGNRYLGYAHYDDLPGHEHKAVSRESAVNQIAILLAGQMAMVMNNFPPDSGWSNDLKRTRLLATKLVVNWGLAPGLEAIPSYDPEGEEVRLTRHQEILVQKEVEKLMHEGKALARERLTEEWPLVRRLVLELMKKGTVTGEEFDIWREELRANPAVQAKAPRNPNCAEILGGLR